MRFMTPPVRAAMAFVAVILLVITGNWIFAGIVFLAAMLVAWRSTISGGSAGADMASATVLRGRVDTGPGDSRADARVEVIYNDMNVDGDRRGPGLMQVLGLGALTATMLTAAGLAQRRPGLIPV